MKVYCYGSINIDHVYQVPHWMQPGETLASTHYQRVLGGKGANQSIALARAGACVSHIGRLGAGDEWAKVEIAASGVDCQLIDVTDQPSGHAIIQVDAAGENSILLYGGANQSFTQADLDELFRGLVAGDWLLLQNECSLTGYAMEAAIKRKVRVAFNPSPLSKDITLLPLEQLALLVLNQVEMVQLFPECEGLMSSPEMLMTYIEKQLPDTEVVVTMGSSGAWWCGPAGRFFVNAFDVEVVDTTAAGDTFLGYLLASIVSGLAPQACLHQASAAAALAVQTSGASTSIPLKSRVEDFLSQSGECRLIENAQ
ncbi:ribokinase [Neptunomonas phycophila]|uniref:Ribokinase n=1 Tax=Neptunomonas phycophila TaxID=1572645 RepID=A0ABT9EY61_9GAMM|nr:ribokinase [Neptunomonas phycophila]MDP2523992.1 ribokinase [Neptunomonas phycophila]